jgi:hypothetical protein
VVPADNKWFTQLVVAAAMNEALDLTYPVLGEMTRATLSASRAKLESEA